MKDRRGLGSAPKAAAATIMSSTITGDPFGGNIPTRKKIENRIDQELESRGSIFSGRDEKSVLMQKRNLQQQHMREELLRQIEEKKNREESIKKRQQEQDMKDEFRIQKDLEQLGQDTGNELGSVGGLTMKKAVSESIPQTSGYLPELTNRKSEPMKAVEMVNKMHEQSKANPEQNTFETTAAFANYKEQMRKEENKPQESQANAENPFSTAIVSETNKIKNMIDQVDNKQELQNQINKKMDIQSNPATIGDESPIGNGPVVGNAKIGELSDIVQQLLEDQRKLKSKLNERDEIIADLSKNRDTRRKNTHEKDRRSRSLKPANNKKIGSADTKSNGARKLREKHTKEKERINAIESKIVKARKRKAEFEKGASQKANKVGGLGNKSNKSRPNSDFDPKLYKRHNEDLGAVEDRKIGKYF